MQITFVKVENFRAHSHTEIPLTQLGSLIGENNAGKSSILHAIQFALEDRRIEESDFKDASLPITVTLHLEGIAASDLERIGETHREKVSGIIQNGKLKIVRSQEYGSKPESKYLKSVPIDPKWDIEVLNAATKNKSGAVLRKAAIELNPALDDFLVEKPPKAAVLKAWQRLIDDLPDEDFEEKPAPFPTGIATAVKPIFPSVIYIEAVKDVTAEAKSTGTSAFAKLLEMLFEKVQGEFEDIETQFKEVHQKLSRHLGNNGEILDTRISAVKRVESVIEDYVKASFPGIAIQMNVPAPTLSMLLASADLLVDDGHLGTAASKGDGLKRTIIFALLRAYTNLKETGIGSPEETDVVEQDSKQKRLYLLLFEEPELYLHPRAQRQLMNALTDFSKDHQVLVTTHSPGFFQPRTKGFTKLQKSTSGVSVYPVDLALSLRDEYQVIKHENNEAAFFARTVVLVEGDSDTIVYPHLAKLFNRDWDDVERNVMFVRMEGKGNITRYRKFFSRFGVPVHVIVDLDALSSGFSHLTSTQSITNSHARLMSLVSELLKESGELNKKKANEAPKNRTNRELWGEAQRHFANWRDSKSQIAAQEIESTLSELFQFGRGDEKLEHLKNPPNEEIGALVEDVISGLALESTYVLRRGDLEAYCGSSIRGGKVSTAIEFCKKTNSLEFLESIRGEEAQRISEELIGIFSGIYSESEGTTS